jgi:hypothetical protein
MNKHHLLIAVSLLALIVALAWGRGGPPVSQSRPIASGTVVSGIICLRPVESSSNTSHSILEGSRVEIYDDFIIVTPPQGVSELSPHGYYRDLKFNKD